MSGLDSFLDPTINCGESKNGWRPHQINLVVLITLNSFQTWQEELVLQSNKKSWFYKEEEKQSRKSLGNQQNVWG